MNTNSNTYTVIYSTILVVVVAAVLASVAMFLKPVQDANVKKDTIGQILTAATFAGVEDALILDTYKEEIESAILVGIEGNKVGELDIESCEVYGTAALKAQIAAEQKALPVYIFKNGVTVVPCYGAGLWGPIWGYVGLEKDLKTIRQCVSVTKERLLDWAPRFLMSRLLRKVSSERPSVREKSCLKSQSRPTVGRKTMVLMPFPVRPSLLRLSERLSTSGLDCTATILQRMP